MIFGLKFFIHRYKVWQNMFSDLFKCQIWEPNLIVSIYDMQTNDWKYSTMPPIKRICKFWKFIWENRFLRHSLKPQKRLDCKVLLGLVISTKNNAKFNNSFYITSLHDEDQWKAVILIILNVLPGHISCTLYFSVKI